MKIVIALDELDMGGAQHVVHTLTKFLDTAKFDVTIICTDGRFGSLLEKQMLAESRRRYSIIFLKSIKYARINKANSFFKKLFNKISRFSADIAKIFEICKTLDSLRPDVIHAHQHGIWTALWALPHGVPLITTLHTNPEATFPRESEKILFYLTLLLKKNMLVGISEYNRARIQAYFNYKNVRAINNGIEIESFYQKPHDTFAFINVSRQDANKNQVLIVRAFSYFVHENPHIPVKLFLIGDGECHALLISECEKLGIAHLVEFTGYIDSAHEYLSVSDVYVSSAHREGLSLSVLEAMAAGLPVIATDVGGVRDLTRENGILIKDDDEDGLLSAMKLLYENKELREEKGRTSLEMVRAYSAREMVRQYAALYEEAVKK